jgi:hypothetical protein
VNDVRSDIGDAWNDEWRDPAAVVAQWTEAAKVDPDLLRAETMGPWWDIIEKAGATLLVSREYEHLVLALSVAHGVPRASWLRLPHPSGIAFDPDRGEVHIGSTRNPNAIYTLRPATGLLDREDLEQRGHIGRPLMPNRTQFLPGSSYLHDLAMIGGDLHATSVGSNSVIIMKGDASPRPVWWPACIEGPDGPAFGLNHLQLNGIAAGPTLAQSFFTASTDKVGEPRPGHADFPVDRRGVVFSGMTRDPIVRGLTRPHSPRFIAGALWVADSGYGTLVSCQQTPEVVAKLPGWTRGLCQLDSGYVIVGTSRIISRFHRYAPGLDPAQCLCGLHAVEIATGRIAASLLWPFGNQIFSIIGVPARFADRLPFEAARSAPTAAERTLFYAWES